MIDYKMNLLNHPEDIPYKWEMTPYPSNAKSNLGETKKASEEEPVVEPTWDDVLDVVLEEINVVMVPKSIIHNRKTGETIVIWRDNKKTVVKPKEGTEESPYFAFVSALAKKIFGSNSKVNRIVDKTFEPTKHVKKVKGDKDDNAS